MTGENISVMGTGVEVEGEGKVYVTNEGNVEDSELKCWSGNEDLAQV